MLPTERHQSKVYIPRQSDLPSLRGTERRSNPGVKNHLKKTGLRR